MSIEIELKCLWHTDGTRSLADLELDFDVDELEHRPVTFYRIDAISRNDWDDKNEFCNIHSGGEKWICVHPYETVKRVISSYYSNK